MNVKKMRVDELRGLIQVVRTVDVDHAADAFDELCLRAEGNTNDQMAYMRANEELERKTETLKDRNKECSESYKEMYDAAAQSAVVWGQEVEKHKAKSKEYQEAFLNMREEAKRYRSLAYPAVANACEETAKFKDQVLSELMVKEHEARKEIKRLREADNKKARAIIWVESVLFLEASNENLKKAYDMLHEEIAEWVAEQALKGGE